MCIRIHTHTHTHSTRRREMRHRQGSWRETHKVILESKGVTDQCNMRMTSTAQNKKADGVAMAKPVLLVAQ